MCFHVQSHDKTLSQAIVPTRKTNKLSYTVYLRHYKQHQQNLSETHQNSLQTTTDCQIVPETSEGQNPLEEKDYIVMRVAWLVILKQ